jgi:hypothetical protein
MGDLECPEIKIIRSGGLKTEVLESGAGRVCQ